MKDYIVSARKYRPTNFDKVVGQEALTLTLKNAIKNNKLAHAYLFCGPRGVGKTTCARIFAKTINCLNLSESGEPCDECESCVAFNEKRSYNIQELDAASNNSIENIRSIIDQVRIPPQVGHYKVFIIDEVHMLSSSAFNAFLKTLEEPPKHVIFILATTEKFKILPTILSRCQIYDFNRISSNDIINYLKKIATSEGVLIDDKSLEIIAQQADGGMRDALSTFDQLVSFSNGNIIYESVLENLNILNEEFYFKITDALLKKDFPNIMLQLNEVLSKGFDAEHFINGLADHFRNLLVCTDAQTVVLLNSTDSLKVHYKMQAQVCNYQFLLQTLKLCNKCGLNYRFSHNKRLLVEMTLLEIAQINQEDDPSFGPVPTKKLKPVFLKSQKSDQLDQKSVLTTNSSSIKEQNQIATNITPTKTSEVSVSPNKEAVVTKNMDSLTNSLDIRTTKKKAPKLMSLCIKGNKERRKIQEDKENLVNEDSDVPQQEEFTLEELNRNWLIFSSRLPREQIGIGERMKNMGLEILANNVIKVKLENVLVQPHFQEISHDLLRFLKSELHNSYITFETEIIEKEEEEHAYTIREQFKEMLGKNVSLKRLVQELNLELDS